MAPSKVGPCGGAGGLCKDMDMTGITGIIKIGVCHGSAIDALMVQFLRYGKEECVQWGRQKGNLTEFILKPSEYITSVKGYMGTLGGAYMVRSLKFETNMGVYGPYGQHEGVPFALPAVDGQVTGFFGRSGDYLDAIGVYVNMAPSPVDRLLTGFQQFKTEVYDKNPDIFEPLKTGQKPKYMLFACCDSRVSPSITLGLQPGEAFMVRNIANMVPPFDKIRYTGEGSALEYGVHHLHVENIVVIGHSKCGGINALMSYKFDGTDEHTDFIADWVKIGFAARKKVKAEYGSKSFDEQCAICEKEAVKVSLENLKTYPFVKKSLEKGALKLFGAHYDFVNGKFEILK